MHLKIDAVEVKFRLSLGSRFLITDPRVISGLERDIDRDRLPDFIATCNPDIEEIGKTVEINSGMLPGLWCWQSGSCRSS
jgi:hypothetical protein